MKSTSPPYIDYANQRISLLTQHGKERVIAQVLDPALGCHVECVTGYDTDQLGSFSRDIPRDGTQIDAARKKARIGMALSGLPLGLASEGSFGPDPYTGMLPWNVEILVFIDGERDIEVVGHAQGAARHAHLLTNDWQASVAFTSEADFPRHQLVVRPESENDSRMKKGIATWEGLEAAFAWAKTQSANGMVFLENDLRAHANPSRMERIREAAEDLVARLKSRCPACGAPGFWMVERIAGLPCADCGIPTRETRADVYGCVKCAHREVRERAKPSHADPSRCDYCNP